MQQSNQCVVKICFRSTDYLGDDTRDNEIRNLADDNKGERDCDSLDVGVRAQNLGPLDRPIVQILLYGAAPPVTTKRCVLEAAVTTWNTIGFHLGLLRHSTSAVGCHA